MRKLTLLITMLFLSFGMAWAQTATFKVSETEGNPEHCYQIKNGNNIWMAANTAPTQNNVALFAFFTADGENAYKIYSIGKKQWVSYDKTSTTDNTKGFATLVDSRDAANPWKITATTIKGGESGFNVQPFNNDGTVGNRYWNWNGGVNVNQGYTYDDTRTIGIWRDPASTDAGSGWMFVQEVEYTITDKAGNVYEGNAQSVNGAAPSFSGAYGYTLTNEDWNGSKYTANIEFKFPVSKVGGVINATTIASAAVAKKWLATDNSVIMVQTSDYDANDNDWLWAIYPQFNNGAFTFKIKSIGQDKWIYTNASGSKVDGGNNDDSAGNAAGAVQLTDEGTAFAVVNSQTVSTCAFHYKVGNSNQYLSINSINDTKVYLGVHTGTHIGSDCYFSKVKTISPVAKIGEQVYYTLAEAVDAAKAAVETSGEVQTITLLADYNGAAIELPIGVTLNKGTFNADDVKVKDLTYVYNFVYGGTVKATQEGSVALGAAFPEIAAENKPFGVTASKPEGNVALADVDQNGNVTKNITVTFNLPFDAAADNASIEKWYYIQMHSYDASTTYNKYIQSVSATEVKWADNSVAAEKQDACTWAFIGNPYDGFKVVNYATGTAIAANGNAPVLSQDGVQWIVTGSTHKPDALHFCLKYPNGEIKYLNANAETGALGFWQNPDAGSTMWVTLRDINSEVTALTSLVEQAQALVEGWSGKVGELTEESKNAVSAAITTANTAIGSKKNLAVAKQDLDAAIGNVQHIEAPSFDGEGTEASPYLIDSADKLATLRDGVNGGEAYEGKYFKLTSDIALNGEWTAIGNGSRNGTGYTGNAFKGVFDGDNKTISGLTITSTTGAKAAIGLFGVVDGGTVKNVNLTNVNINVPNSDLAGAAIGMMLNGATAEGITVSGAVVGHDGVGGIVGRLIIDGTIANCTNNASVTSNYGGIGGIVGKAYYEDGANTATFASITNCTNKGTITAPMYVGGIVGLARANVTNCVNEGAIVGGTQTGGIIGQLMAAGTVSANENKATVGGTSHVGGIIGDYSQSSSYTYNNVSIANNTNRGELSAQQCAAIMGCNNIDGFTAMTATGNQSFYFVEGLELFGNPEDMVIDATNKFVVPVAQVGAETFYTFAEAAAAVQAGGEIKLLADATVEGTLALPAGIKLTSNGHTVNGSIRMLGDLTLNGPLTITGGLWVGKSGETLTATLSGDKLTASYFMFQHGTYTINADIDALHGYLSFGGTFEVNSTIHTTGTNGEVLYIRGNVNLNADAVLDSDNSVFLDNDNAVLTLKPGSKVDSNVSITTSGAKLNIDATGMTAGASANITGTVTNSGNGTIAVVGNDKFEAKIVDGKVVLAAKPVAKIGETGYNTLADALEATKTMTGDVTVEILDKVTFNQPLIGNYTSINFVGKDTDAEMYLDVQGYTTATGKKVSFTDLKLSKSEGGYIANAGFMNVAFGVYDVAEVTYTNCTFANGAYAAFGKVTYTGCTFKKSWEKYGLWAYGDADVTVDGCTFADYRGIKMYAEGGADASVAKANLTVKNTNFSAVDNKPAIVLTYGESVVLEGNTYSSTGTFELDLDGKPNGVAVTSDVAPVCVNDNGACGVLVDGKIYTTVAQAAEVATETSTVTLLHSSNETVEFPLGTTIEKNGFTADNVTTAQPFAEYVVLPQDITVNNYKAKFGSNTVTDGTNYYATLQAAVEAIAKNAGVARQAGAVLYCKPGADVGALQHAPVVSTLTIYGNDANVTGGAERDFDLGNTDPSVGKDITADMTLTVEHLNGCGVWGAKATEHTVNLVFANCANMGKVFVTGTTGTLNITMTDCAFEGVLKEAVYSNADGAITLNNVAFSNLNKAVNLNHKAAGTQTVTINGCSFTNCGADVAADQIPVRVLSSVEGGKSVLNVSNTTFTGTPEGGADILLDYAVGLTEASIATTAANVVVENENNVGTSTTTEADKEYALTTAKPVAKIGDVEYMTLADAVAAAQNDATITLIGNVELAEMVTIPADKTLTIDLNGKAISMQESIIATAYAINNLGNLTITDGVGGGSVNARGMYNGYGNGGENVASAKLTINGGTFNAKGTNGGAAIFNYGTANVNAGTFTSIGGYSLNNQAGSTMTIADGVSANNGVYNSNATLTIDGGEISGNRSGCHVIYAWNSTLTINGGEFYNNNSGNATIMSAGTSVVTINDGTFGIKDGRVPGNGNTWTSCLTDVANSAQIIVNGGTFNGGFRVQSGTTMTINGGSFNDCYGSNYNIYGTTVVKGGTFTDDTAKAFATKYVAEGYELNEEGIVVEEIVVATIGDKKYATLQAAIDAAILMSGDVTIEIMSGTYAEDINLTNAAVTVGDANARPNITFKPAAGADVTLAGTTTLGYRIQNVGASMWQGEVIFEGIKFNHAENAKHSLDIQDVKGITLLNCTITGDGEYGIGSNGSNATPKAAFTNCTFENGAMQVLGQLSANLVIDNSTFNNFSINAQGGTTPGLTIKNSIFNMTLTDAHVGQSFYVVRSNANPITIQNTKVNVDSEVSSVAADQAKWGLFWARQDANAKWNIDACEVNLTDAAMAQTELLFTKNAATTYDKAKERIVITNLTSASNNVADLVKRAEGCATVNNVKYLNGELDLTGLVAKVGDAYYATISDALAAAKDGETVNLLWKEGAAPLAMNGSVFGKKVTIKGTAKVDWSKGFLFVGRGGEGNATVTFDGANLTSASNSASTGIHVSGREKNTTNKYDGTLVIKNSTIVLDYLINRNAIELDNATLTVKHGFGIAGRPASETESSQDATATISLANNSKVVVNNHNGMGLGQAANVLEGFGVMNVDATSTFETTMGFVVTAKGTMNLAGTAKVEGTLTNNGSIVLTALDATLTSTECGNVTTNVAEKVVYYNNGAYTLRTGIAKIGEVAYLTLQDAVNAVQNGDTITLTNDIAENVTLTEKTGLYYTIDGAGQTMKGSINVTSLSDTEDNRRITIKNIQFVDDSAAKVDFISSVATNHYPRLTVEGCTFTGSGDAIDVAVRLKSSHSVVIKDCTGTGLHSFIQNTSGWNLTIEDVTVTDSKGGFALGTVQGVTVKECTADVQGYGIRLDAQYNNNAVLESNNIKAFIPVVVRKAEVESNVTVKGTNTMNATNTDGLWCAVGTSEYETEGQMPTAATGQVVVTLNDTNLDNEGIYGDYVVLAGEGTEAEPYLIKDIKELVAFRNSVNGGETRYSAPGVWVALAADIDLAGLNWVGIGSVTAEHGFMGNFDGKGFKIKNLTITNPTLDSDDYAYAGFFSVTEGTDKDNQNTIKNLTIENVTITTTRHIVSAAIAYPYYTIVDNVKVCGNIAIQGGDYTAGVLAYTRRCVNASNLSIVGNDGSFVKGNKVVGGVISDIQMNGGLTAVYSKFSAEGITVSGEKSVGGISGIISTQTLNGASVKNVTLNSKDGFAGIVAGRLGDTSVITDVVAENVTGATAVVGAIYELAKAVQAKIGNTYYATLEDALKAEGNAVELLTTYEVAAGETKTLDLKGKTVTMVYTAKATKNHTMVSNSGNLTIESSVEGGKLSYTYAGENLGTTYAANTVTSEPGSVLTVKSGTIENLTFDSAVIAYAIDGRTNGGAGDVTVNIEGGVITSKRQAVRIFANSTTNTGALNISGGEFTGRVIVQNASAKANKAALNITGGTFNANEYKSDVLYVGGSSSAEIDINATVSGGTFNGEITETNVTKFISGGTYKNAVEAAYCADGYMPNKNTNGTYGVVAVADAYASIDGVTYGSLKAAVTAAKTGETITLLQNVKESVTISKALTLDGAGKTLTGMITTKINGKVTIKNLYFNGDGQKQSYAVRADNMGTLTVENCTAVDYLYGFLYANKSNDKIVVKDVTVENCAEYGAYLVAFNKASFENFEVIGTTKYGVAVANAGNRIVNFKNVSFEDAETPLNINETGTGKVTFNFSGINDMSKAEFYTSQYVNVVAAAQVGTKVCGSLQDAVVAANDGETVKVLADVNMTTANFVTQVDGYATLVNVAGKAVTIDLNGKKVTVNAAHADLNGKAESNMLMSVFHADPNGTLTLTDSSAEGTGTVELFANDAKVYALIVSENQYDKSHPGKIFVNGGNYVADKLNDSMIFADINEVITVNGGNFHLGNVGEGTNGKPWIFNASGSNTMHINVNGGTYNANVAKQYWTNEVNLGEGLTTTNNGDGTWTVVSGVATVGEELFGTIQEALDAAQDGDTVKLIADVTLDTKKYTTQVDNLVVLFNVKGKAVTFDLNGKKIDVNASAANLGGKMLAGVFSADLEGNFTITDNSAERTGAVTVTVNDAKVYSVFLSENAGDKTKSGKMTVNAGNFTTIGKVANAMIYADTDKVITINGGTFICDGVSTSEAYPWMFNTVGNNELYVTVNGGTFNVDINHQYRPFEVFVPETLAVKANDNGTWTIVPAQAYVTEMLGNYVNEPGNNAHKVGYATIAEAIAATNDLGKVVTILAGDYTMDIAANKAGVTVQGEVDENGQNLVNITGRVVPSTGTTVKNLNVKNEKKGDYDCALYVDGKDIVIDGVNLSGYNGMRMGYAKGNITIKNSVIEGSSNAVHFDGSEGGVIAFENSTITGYCAYAGTIESVTYTNCTLNKGKYFGQRFYNKNVNFVGCTFGEGFKIELAGSKQNVTFTDADMTMDDVKALMKKESYITSHNVKLNDTQVTYAVSAQGKLYNTLQAAINDLPVGGTATYYLNLKSDNELTEGVVVPAGVKATINLNGFNIIGTPAEAKAYAVITNRGSLTIEGNGSVICNHTLAGSTGYAVNTITNCGTLTIDGATIENTSTAQYQIGYAIDNNSTSTDAVVNIKRGKVTASGSLYYDGIRQFCNSETKENSVVVEGGEVSTIWMQNPSDGTTKNTKDVKGSVTIEGGNVGVLSLEPSANFEAAMTGGHVGEISYFQTATGRDLKEFVTGGTFGTPIDENFLAWGYQLTGDADLYEVEYTGRRESVTIVDGQLTEFVNEEDIEVGTLTYTRTLASDLYNALYVPFEIPVADFSEKYEFYYFNDVHSDINGVPTSFEIVKITKGTLKANHPYLVKPINAEDKNMVLEITDAQLRSTTEKQYVVDCSSAYTLFTVRGTYSVLNGADYPGCYGMSVDGDLALIGSGKLGAFRIYLQITDRDTEKPVILPNVNNIRLRVIGEGSGDTTDIKYYDVENQNVELIFDLQGRRVLEPKKGGIYIINGKKVYYNK